jgi:hypothetical protein
VSGSAAISGGLIGGLSASGVAQASGSGFVKATVDLTAAGFVQAMGAGSCEVRVSLGSIGSALATGAAIGNLSGGDGLFYVDRRYMVAHKKAHRAVRH